MDVKDVMFGCNAKVMEWETYKTQILTCLINVGLRGASIMCSILEVGVAATH